MIKHKKIIICILLTYALFIFGMFDVRAYENGITGTNLRLGYNNSYTDYSRTSLGDYSIFDVRFSNTIRNFSINFQASNEIYIENGIIQVSGFIASDIPNTGVGPLSGATLYLGSDSYACELTNFSDGVKGDSNNSSGYTWTANCNIDKGTIQTSLTGNAIRLFYTHNDNDFHLIFGLYHILTWNYNNNADVSTITNNTTEINNNIKDSSIDTSTSDSSTSGFSDTTNSSMSNTPVSNLITLPITFLSGVNSAISGSCTNVNYIELFGYQLVLPCLNLSERLGNVWVIIDTIFSCMLIFSIGKSLVSTFARLSDMDTNIMYECYENGAKHRGESLND